MACSLLREIDAATVRNWMNTGEALVVDIREPEEFVRESIAGARLVPLSSLETEELPEAEAKIVVFHCATGYRTCLSSRRLLGADFDEVYQLAGGLSVGNAPASRRRSTVAPPSALCGRYNSQPALW